MNGTQLIWWLDLVEKHISDGVQDVGWCERSSKVVVCWVRACWGLEMKVCWVDVVHGGELLFAVGGSWRSRVTSGDRTTLPAGGLLCEGGGCKRERENSF